MTAPLVLLGKYGDNPPGGVSASDVLSGIGGTPKLVPAAVKTTAYTSTGNEIVPADATSAAFTVKLPNAPVDGTRVCVKKIDTGKNAVTIACQGSDVLNKSGGSTSAALTLTNQAATLQYKTTGAIWYVVGDDLPLSSLSIRNGAFEARHSTEISSVGLWLNNPSPTYGPWYTFGTSPNSMGFAGNGSPPEAYAPIVFYQEYGDYTGLTGASIPKTTQGFAQLCNYWGPTLDDSAQASSRFLGMKAVPGGYTQTKRIAGDELILQLETGVDASSLVDGNPISAQGAHINVLGTAHAGTAVMFMANNNVYGGGVTYGTIDKFIAFGQLTGSRAAGGTVTNAYGVYVVDQIASETGLHVGSGTWGGAVDFSAAGDGRASPSLAYLQAGSVTGGGPNVATLTLRGAAGQTNSILNCVDSGGTGRFQVSFAGSVNQTGVQYNWQTSGGVPQVVITGGSSVGSVTLTGGVNIILSATTGTKIGTATTQKLGFFNATPVVQQSLAAAASDAATTQTLANSLRSALIALGLGA